MRRAVSSSLAALAAGALLAACGDDEPTGGQAATDTAAATTDGGAMEQQGFDAHLEPLNDSGVEGRAILSQLGSRLRIQITAEGLVPRREHPQHIHRLESGAAGSCPTEADDADGDGIVSLDESLASYGPVALELEPFPRAGREGDASFQGTFELDPDLEPLTDRVVVLHGLGRGSGYDPSVPVACGRIR